MFRSMVYNIFINRPTLARSLDAVACGASALTRKQFKRWEGPSQLEVGKLALPW